MPNEKRCLRLIRQAISNFGLQLSGQVVLTEAASGYYILTPLIAALAGAEHILALTRDSQYGLATDIRYATNELARIWGIHDRVDVVFSRHSDSFRDANIITNLGFVRPLDAKFLRQLGQVCAIPLMWETWEYRSEDLDLDMCRQLNIPILGTNERHRSLQTMGYIGPLVLKLLFELNIEVFQAKLVVLGSGEFANQVVSALTRVKAEVALIETQSDDGVKIEKFRDAICTADALVIVEHHDRRMLVGSDGDISIDDLLSLNSDIAIAHICGGVDQAELNNKGICYVPGNLAPAGYMSVATDYLGPKPLIDLHVAGLKVGQLMAEARLSGLSGWNAELSVLEQSSLAQGFADYHPSLE